MALTASTSTFDTNVNKRHAVQALLNSKAKIFVVTVTYGAGDNYATGGNAISLKNGEIGTYLAVIPVENDKRLALRYDTTNEKILAFGQEPTNATAGVIQLVELAASSAIVNSMVASFLVIGV